MTSQTYDIFIIGGGIVGLATAYQILQKHPHLKLCLLEKEKKLASHQTGHNSGVMHSGLYYKPGSLKAKNCVQGRLQLIDFAKEFHIRHKICGKMIVATCETEIPHMDRIMANGQANGVKVERLDAATVQKLEPHCTGIGGLHVPEAGLIDFVEVAETLARILQEKECRILTSCEVIKIKQDPSGVELRTSQGSLFGKHLIACAGLQSDRLAKKEGIKIAVQIVPFRGDYYELQGLSKEKVGGLIYPVPDPVFPFLGVHFTRKMDGHVKCGPSAVLSFKREGYGKTDISIKDAFDSLTFPGVWRLLFRYWRPAFKQYRQAFSKKFYLKQLQRIIPNLHFHDLFPATSGVRAQALGRDGKLLDDFCIEETENSIHVLNAPSPGATASFAIGDTIQGMATRKFGL